MVEKKVIKEPGMWEPSYKQDDFDDPRMAPVYIVHTHAYEFRANSLHKALKLWADHGPDREVLDVERLG